MSEIPETQNTVEHSPITFNRPEGQGATADVGLQVEFQNKWIKTISYKYTEHQTISGTFDK